MTTTYAVRGSRQMIILTVIFAFHFAMFALIVSGLGPPVLDALTTKARVTLIPKEADPIERVVPARAEPVDFYYQPVLEPDLSIPAFDRQNNALTSRTGAEPPNFGSGEVNAASGEYLPPGLRTRDRRLAALIDSCYPAASRRLGEEGRAVARITIDGSGNAVSWIVAESSGFARLDAAMSCVIEPLDFIAGRRDGRAVEAQALLPIVFRLD